MCSKTSLKVPLGEVGALVDSSSPSVQSSMSSSSGGSGGFRAEGRLTLLRVHWGVGEGVGCPELFRERENFLLSVILELSFESIMIQLIFS